MLDATQKYREQLTNDRLFGWHASLFPTGRSGMRQDHRRRLARRKSGPMRVVSGDYGRERVHYRGAGRRGALLRDAELSRLVQWSG